MIFSSAEFLFLFLPCTLLLYYIPFFRSLRYRNTLLLLVSLFFYAWGEPVYVLLLMLSILVNWLLGGQVGADKPRRRAALIGAVAFNLSGLFVFKYLGFVCENLGLMGLPVPAVQLALPIGISFYTFQAMSYVIDVYRGKSPAQRSVLDVGLYVAFFPQLIAGPIVRYETVALEIHNRVSSWADFCDGVPRLIVGLGKKCILANSMALVADGAFNTYAPSAPMAWLGALAYALQIYFDFSGYSDMAIGMGRMFGFHFLENFNRPYLAVSITDFWRRWHISLSTWFRDYVYIPLGGNRTGPGRHLFNLFVVWMLTGIWHGANWTFLFWGLYFFALLMLEKFFLLKPLEKAPAVVGHVYTMFFVMVSWAIFAIEDLGHLAGYLKVMFGLGGVPLTNSWFGYYLTSYLPVLCLAALASTPLGASIYRRLGQKAQYALCTVLVAGGLLVCTAYLVAGTYNPFLYFNF